MKRLTRQTNLLKSQSAKTHQVTRNLYSEIRSLIEAAREQAAQAVNSGLVLMYWQIGSLIRKNVLGEERAEYGKQIFYALSRKLTEEFGVGFSQANLFHMVRFAEVFPEQKIVASLMRQLSWTHLRQIIYLDDSLKREFILKCAVSNGGAPEHLKKKSPACSTNALLFLRSR